ncbi:MAG: UDP-N-acetylmuramate--alanine ligase [Sphingomonas sp.]|uniref:Mur ligase family protein n=1 Tax=Sphingomonas sp. TaxID=28214 RepID=UPI001AD3BE69|nr:Mur ligase family protein [Sphingomonas sp.]MBN8813914.1 UDP-N-acetylmuramate--alanine ligase [Sphingomonas sp.]
MPDANSQTEPSDKPAFFVGIGGSGMMPLAMILAARGRSVAGSDRSLDQSRLPAKFDYLRDLGVDLFPQDGSGITSPDQIVVASAAIEAAVPDMVTAERLGCERRTRAEMLAELFNDSTMPIGVAGTSGKSTVTGMIGWILHATNRDPTVMNGAVMKNFATPNAPFASSLVGGGDAFVSEVDESDGSIALFAPRVAVLNNVSLDHKSLEELNQLFGDFIAKAEVAVINLDNPDGAALTRTLSEQRVVGFSINADAEVMATGIEERPFGAAFTLAVRDHDPIPVELQVPGRHNISNALAAIAAAHAAGVALDEAAVAIGGFTGLRRRFELVGETQGVAVLDDFGHNPDKIAATLTTLHAFPGRLLVLFQPHGYGPLKVMRRELVEAFAANLKSGDVLILPDPAYYGGTVEREVTSADIVADLVAKGCDARHIADRTEAAAAIAGLAQGGDRTIVMGARDDTLSQVAGDILAAIAERPGDAGSGAS